METVLGAAGLAVALILLWTGLRRVEVSSFYGTVLTVIDLALFLVSIIALGLIGVGVFIAVSSTAIVVWSVVLAVKKQSILVNASTQGVISTEEAEDLYGWMGQEKSFSAMRPLTRAELVRVLAARTHTPSEIRAMAVPIAQLSAVFDCDPIWLAPRYDRLVRGYGRSAHQATEVADELSRITKATAASFEETVDALLLVVDDTGGDGDPAPDGDVSSTQFLETLRAVTELRVAEDGAQGVRLNGGPMDGWLTLPHAPCLRADWHKTWPPTLKQHNKPGRYQLAGDRGWADWVPLAEPR